LWQFNIFVFIILSVWEILGGLVALGMESNWNLACKPGWKMFDTKASTVVFYDYVI